MIKFELPYNDPVFWFMFVLMCIGLTVCVIANLGR